MTDRRPPDHVDYYARAGELGERARRLLEQLRSSPGDACSPEVVAEIERLSEDLRRLGEPPTEPT